MSIEAVKSHLKAFGMEDRVLEYSQSSATVALAAQALGCEPGRIAKSLSFATPEGGALLVVAAGDVKIDNSAFKKQFGFKAKMLTHEQVPNLVGHDVGGVCPFGLKEGVQVWLDASLKRFTTVFPACGTDSSAIELTIDELYKSSGALGFVSVTKDVEPR